MATNGQKDWKQGRTMRYWLSAVCKDQRETAGKSPEAIATAAGTGYSSVLRFENGDSWPREFDRLVAGYAECVGIEDPRDLWQQALVLWHEHGQRPTVNDLAT